MFLLDHVAKAFKLAFKLLELLLEVFAVLHGVVVEDSAEESINGADAVRLVLSGQEVFLSEPDYLSEPAIAQGAVSIEQLSLARVKSARPVDPTRASR